MLKEPRIIEARALGEHCKLFGRFTQYDIFSWDHTKKFSAELYVIIIFVARWFHGLITLHIVITILCRRCDI